MRRVHHSSLIVLCLVGVLTACGHAAPVSEPRPSASPTVPRGVTIINVGGRPCASTAGAGAMWVTNYADGTVSRIDPATNRVTKVLRVGSKPCGIAYLDGHLWVALVPDQKVVEVDPKSGKTLRKTSIGGSVFDLQTGFGSIWVDDNATHVLRIDPATAKVTAKILVGELAMIYGLAVTPEGVWAADDSGNQISHIDPATNTVIARIPDPSGTPFTFAYTPGALWVSSLPGATLRIDPVHNTVVTSVRFGAVTSGAPGDPDGFDGRVWVPNTDDGTLAVIDPATNKIISKITLGTGYEVAQAGFGSIWDCDFQGSTIARVDPSALG